MFLRQEDETDIRGIEARSRKPECKAAARSTDLAPESEITVEVMEIVSYGDRIAQGTYSVHSRFRRAVNFVNGGALVSLVDATVGCGPINIVVSGLDPDCFEELRVENDRFLLGGRSLSREPERQYSSSMDLDPTYATRFTLNLEVLGQSLRDAAPSRSLAFLIDDRRAARLAPGYERCLLARMKAGLNLMREGRLGEAAGTLRGSGFGLTPSGDDFLSGFLIGLCAAERIRRADLGAARRAIYESALGTNVVVNSCLACSRDGRVPRRIRDLVGAMARSGAETVRSSALRVFEMGETSGADVAAGFYLSFETASEAWNKPAVRSPED